MKEGILKRYTIDVNEEVLGRNIFGFVLLNVTPGNLEDVVKYLLENEHISAIYEIHGPNDLILKIWSENLDEMRDKMLEIREVPNVTTSELITIYKVWKERNY